MNCSPIIDLSQTITAINMCVKTRDLEGLAKLGIDTVTVSPHTTKVSLYSPGKHYNKDNVLEALHANLHRAEINLKASARKRTLVKENGRRFLFKPIPLQVRLRNDLLPAKFYYNPVPRSQEYILDASNSESGEYLLLEENKHGRKSAELCYKTDKPKEKNEKSRIKPSEGKSVTPTSSNLAI